MYRARSVVAGLLPLLPGSTPEHLASWLAKGYLRKSVSTKLPLPTLTGAGFRHYSAAPPPPPGMAEPFLNGTSTIYVEEMYNSWLQDPKSVHVVSIIFRRTNRKALGLHNIPLTIYKCRA